MNNFLRQFGSFKKNQNGLNEYVDYLGAKYTQDPKTGMWKTNGRSLNEQMLFEEALKSQGGYGGEEGSGGRSQASRANYNIGLAATEADALAGISVTTEQFSTSGHPATSGNSSEFFITATPNNRPVPVYFKFISSDNIVDIISDASISFNLPLATTLATFNVVTNSVAVANNSISSTFTLPVYDRSTLNNNKCKFSFTSAREDLGLIQFDIQLINSLNNSVIITLDIQDESE